jgi:hypothetical protein
LAGRAEKNQLLRAKLAFHAIPKQLLHCAKKGSAILAITKMLQRTALDDHINAKNSCENYVPFDSLQSASCWCVQIFIDFS